MQNSKAYKISNLDKRYLLENLWWNNKPIIFTRHFQKELDEINKTRESILDILKYGEHKLIAKKQNKYNVFYPYKKKYLCLSYVKNGEIILIHIKPTTKK